MDPLPSPKGKPALALDVNIVQDNLPTEIIPKLYIGSIHAAFNQDSILAEGITHILNASRLPSTFPKVFTYLTVDLRDKESANILSCIPSTNIFIEAGMESGAVLVHCFGGRSRSAALIVAYIMSTHKCTYDTAYTMIYKQRSSISINRGFEAQLRAYQQANFDVYRAQQMLLHTRIRKLSVLREDKEFVASLDVTYSRAGSTSKSNPLAGTAPEVTPTTSSGAGGTIHSVEQEKPAVTPGKRPFSISTALEVSPDAVGEVAEEQMQMPPPTSLPLSTSNNRTILSPFAASIRKFIPLFDSKAPHCRLSRPSTGSIRIIPPLRGLESQFTCGWCRVPLFNLGNVIRLDITEGLKVVTDVDMSEDNESCPLSTSPIPLKQSTEDIKILDDCVAQHDAPVVNYMAPPVSSRAGKTRVMSFPEPDIEAAPSTDNGVVCAKYVPAMHSSRAGKAVPFSFNDEPPSQEFKPKLEAISSARGSGFDFPPSGTRSSSRSATPQQGMRINTTSGSIGTPIALRSPGGKSSIDDSQLPIPSSARRNSSTDGLASSKPSSASGMRLAPIEKITKEKLQLSLPPANRNASFLLPEISAVSPPTTGINSVDESPRILCPDVKHSSPSLQTVERKRWLERVNLLQCNSKSSLSVIINDPNSSTGASTEGVKEFNALQLDCSMEAESPTVGPLASLISLSSGFAGEFGASENRESSAIFGTTDKVAKLAQTDEAVHSAAIGDQKYMYLEYLEWMGVDILRLDEGELLCSGCGKVIGGWYWKPSARQSLNGLIHAPVIRIPRNVVIETAMQLDRTPTVTPRVDAESAA